MPVSKFELDGHSFYAENCIDGILINPQLPDNFDNTDNSERPDDQEKWWYRPFVVAEEHESYQNGIRYDVRCLDGGAWDRSTGYGFFSDLDTALKCAKEMQND